MDRPTLHQNSTPAKGQLTARHVSVSMPFGTHSLLAGFAMTYGSCAMPTGKSRATGTRIRRYSILAARSAASCCSGVSVGISILSGGLTAFLDWAGAYDAIDWETSKSRKYRDGHSDKKQRRSWIAGRTHRKGNVRSCSFMRSKVYCGRNANARVQVGQAGGPAYRIAIYIEGAPSKLCLGGVFVGAYRSSKPRVIAVNIPILTSQTTRR